VESHRKDDMHPSSRHADGQPGSPSHGDGMDHHKTHPSAERAFNRAEAPIEVHHHSTEPADDAAAQYRERLERHGRRR
jgi:hypothetical protein